MNGEQIARMLAQAIKEKPRNLLLTLISLSLTEPMHDPSETNNGAKQ